MLHTKLRTGLTMLGIIIGISSVIIVSSVGKGQLKILRETTQNLANDQYDISLNSNGSSYKITDDSYFYSKDIEILSDETNILGISPMKNLGRIAIVRDNKLLLYSGHNNEFANTMLVNQDYLKISNLKLFAGRNFTKNENRDFAIIDDLLAEKLFGSKDAIGKKLQIETRALDKCDLIIIGVVKNPYYLADQVKSNGDINYMILLPYGYYQKRLRINKIEKIIVKFKNNVNCDKAIPELLNNISNLKKIHEGAIEVKPPYNSYAGIEQTVEKMNVYVLIVSVIALLVGGIGIMDIVLVIINERVKEIGLRKALGAKNRDILIQFLIEAVIITFTGGIIGILIGIIGCFVADAVCIVPPVIDWSIVIISTFVSILIGIIFGLYPALKAARMNPIDALRKRK